MVEKPNSIDTKRTLFHPILMHFAARFSKKTYGEFASDYRVLVETNMKCHEYFGTDAVSVISDPYCETSAFGAKIIYEAEGVPHCVEKVVKSSEDIKTLKIPEVYNCERTLNRIKGVEYYRKLVKPQVDVIGWVEGPLAEACDLMGVTEMLMLLATDEELTKILLDKCLITGKAFAKAQVENGANIIGVGDAICSQISAEMYREFIFNRHKELIDYIHTLGAKVKLHICGNIKHLVPDLKILKPDIVDVDWMVGMEELYAVFGEKIIRCGNIDPVSVIERLSAGEVYKITKELIKKEEGRPFILSGGCEITVNTPKENLLAMKRALKDFVE